MYVCILFRSIKLALLWMRNVRVEITILIIYMLKMVTQVALRQWTMMTLCVYDNDNNKNYNVYIKT